MKQRSGESNLTLAAHPRRTRTDGSMVFAIQVEHLMCTLSILPNRHLHRAGAASY